MNKDEQNLVLEWFSKNQFLVLGDILKGRGSFAAEWFLVIRKLENEPLAWVLKHSNEVVNFYSGEVKFTKDGNLRIGKVGVQRKGGDGGGEGAKLLQFKIDPCAMF